MTTPSSHPEHLEPATGLRLSHPQLHALSPDVRDQLLEYVALWSTPEQQLELAEALRELHGAMLFLLDYQARALFRCGKYEDALRVLERRQRRSTTVGSQALEAQALLAAGHDQHAQAVVDDISSSYGHDITAVHAAARVFTGLGRYQDAAALLDSFLARRPHHRGALLTLAECALEADDRDAAVAALQQLGAGVPADISDANLARLSELATELGFSESAKAAQLELQRRRQAKLDALRTALAPIADLQPGEEFDANSFYRSQSGPESLAVERREARNIQLEAVRHFGFMKLRPGQIEAIASVLRSESILTVMPTGAGKSLCYQLPALILPRATLVISPLIALMKDQVEGLPAAARARATFVNSTLSDAELAERMRGIAAGQYKLIYAAPERLRQRSFLRALHAGGLDLFVVDEAHCVSLWGHDFRPDYLFIQEARHELGNPPALAMTATAPPRVRDEIVQYLSVDDGVGVSDARADGATDQGDDESTAAAAPAGSRPHVMTLDIFRDNLHLSAMRFHNEEEKLRALLKFVQETEGSGIVYVNSRQKCEALAVELRRVGVAAEPYHAGLGDRNAVQDRFMANTTRVVVATVAFGMGIDKADIRFIVHFHPPRSLASYYQEVGRAGRDGKKSQGLLFFSNNDWANLRRWAKADEYSVEFLLRAYTAVANQLDVKLVQDETTGALQAADELTESVFGPVDAHRLNQVLNSDETSVRVAISILERVDLVSRSFDVPREVEIGLKRNPPAVAEQDPDFALLRRGLALAPGRKASFQLADVAAFLGWGMDEAEAQLLDWEQAGFLTFKGSRRAMFIELPPPPTDAHERLARLLNQSAALAHRRIDDVVGYATAETCRHGYISMHFGSPPRDRCEVCDNCTGIRPELPQPDAITHALPDDADIEPMILDCLISLPKPVGRSGLARILTGSLRAPVKAHQARHHGRLKELGEAAVMNYVDDLLDSNHLRQYERNGYPVLAATIRGRADAEAWLAEHPEYAAYADMAPEDMAPEDVAEDAAGDKYTALQKALWVWRRRTSEEFGLPPYVIMSNELMLRIAETRPDSDEALATLPGMGAQRMQHHSAVILDLIKLNPPDENDEHLLAAQRAELTDASGRVRRAAKTAVVSPQTERKIFLKLQELRQKCAVQERIPAYQIANNGILKQIAAQAPETQADLEAIVGFRSSGLNGSAAQILEIVAGLVKE